MVKTFALENYEEGNFCDVILFTKNHVKFYNTSIFNNNCPLNMADSRVETERMRICSCIRGYHIYKTIWEVRISEILKCN